MFFGDAAPFSSALDVVAHELTHGVTEHSANLLYEFQSGALNESFSDIFGVMVEAWARGEPDWKIGEEVNLVRDLKDPHASFRSLPSKMSEYVQSPNTKAGDWGGVHVNSSIFNHCHYLLAAGLDGAIGAQDAEKIFYRALTQHLNPQSQFTDARLACTASAEELFGASSTQAQKVGEAFDAVEIFACATDCPALAFSRRPGAGLHRTDRL